MSSPTSIVPVNDILTVQEIHIHAEDWNLNTLAPELANCELALKWCARRQLIHNTHHCLLCTRLSTLCRYTQGIDGRHWCCSACRTSKSVRDKSFLSKGHLTLQQIVAMVNCWSWDMTQLSMQQEARVGNTTVVDWCNFLREECQTWLGRNSGKIGGIDPNFNSIVVEIDESKFFHRMYNRGQWQEGHWVFGGIEREGGKCFLVVVPDRTAATLLQCIEDNIEPGTHIISDGWAAYANIRSFQNGIYDHSVVVHKHNFVDPADPEVHTQNIENLWMRAKRKIRRQFGTSESLFPSYLKEFEFRNQFVISGYLIVCWCP